MTRFNFCLASCFFFLVLSYNGNAQIKVESDGKVGIDANPTIGKLEVGDINANSNRSKVMLGSEFWLGNYNGSWDVAFLSARDNTTNPIGIDFRVQKPGGGVHSIMVLKPPTTSNGTNDFVSFKTNSFFTEDALFHTDATFLGDIYYYGSFTYQGSDRRLKSNISPIKLDYVTRLYNLNAKYYTRMAYPDNLHSTREDSLQSELSFPKSWEEHGFIAQEFQEVYPELVVENEEGYLSIQYDALIPIMVEALKSQKEEIDNLKSALQSNERRGHFQEKETMENDPILKQVKLFQNRPNPFSETTRIEYFLPEQVKDGIMYIFDLQGKQIQTINLRLKNEGYIEIDGNTLEPGMYIYALIVDGVEIASKRMIITE